LQGYCEEHGGYLADILSQQEQDIATELASNGKYPVQSKRETINEKRDESVIF
jgi:hypothetical protein